VPVLAELRAGPFTLRGMSLGGVYTSIHVPELDCVFDVGIALRSASACGTLFLSHGHADHVGALTTFLGIRALHGKKSPLKVVMPAEIVDDLQAGLAAMAALQRWPLTIEPIGLRPGDTYPLRKDLIVRAVKTFHPVPSLGFLLCRQVDKLKRDFHDLPGPEIARRRAAGEDLFDRAERAELAYLTDTLISVIDHSPEVLAARTLILESTFLDDRKSREAARAGCHVHLDEIVERADAFALTSALALMHVSQLYQPGEVGPILDARLPPALRAKTHCFAPSGPWPG
jgi:ribonuclease Z